MKPLMVFNTAAYSPRVSPAFRALKVPLLAPICSGVSVGREGGRGEEELGRENDVLMRIKITAHNISEKSRRKIK